MADVGAQPLDVGDQPGGSSATVGSEPLDLPTNTSVSPDTSSLHPGFVDFATHAATAGLSDHLDALLQAAGAVSGGMDLRTDTSFWDRYSKNLHNIRNAYDSYEQGDINKPAPFVPRLIDTGAALGQAAALGPEEVGESLLARALQWAKTGSKVGAVNALGASDLSNPVQTGINTARGATIGAVTGVGTGILGRTMVNPVAEWVARTNAPINVATRKISDALGADAANVVNATGPGTIMDVGGEPARALARDVVASGGPPAKVITDFLDSRDSAMDSALAANPQNISSPKIDAILDTSSGKAALAQSANIMQHSGKPMGRAGATGIASGLSLEALHHVVDAYDPMIAEAADTPALQSALVAQKNTLLDEMNRFDRTGGGYQAARDMAQTKADVMSGAPGTVAPAKSGAGIGHGLVLDAIQHFTGLPVNTVAKGLKIVGHLLPDTATPAVNAQLADVLTDPNVLSRAQIVRAIGNQPLAGVSTPGATYGDLARFVAGTVLPSGQRAGIIAAAAPAAATSRLGLASTYAAQPDQGGQ